MSIIPARLLSAKSVYIVLSCGDLDRNLIQDIFQKIDRCSIFIADITTNNANVLYEFGYAKGKGKDYILLLNKDKNPTPPKSDYHNELRHEFQGYQNLKAVLKTQIEAVLKERRYF